MSEVLVPQEEDKACKNMTFSLSIWSKYLLNLPKCWGVFECSKVDSQ